MCVRNSDSLALLRILSHAHNNYCRVTSIAGDIDSHSPLGFISILASSRGVRPDVLKGLMAGPLKAMRPFKQSTLEYCKEKQRNTCSVMHMSLDCSVVNDDTKFMLILLKPVLS